METNGTLSCSVIRNGVGVKISREVRYSTGQDNMCCGDGQDDTVDDGQARNKCKSQGMTEDGTGEEGNRKNASYFWSSPSVTTAGGPVIGPGGLPENDRILACKSIAEIKEDGEKKGLSAEEVKRLLRRRQQCRRR